MLKEGNLRKATFTNPEGSKFFQVRRGPNPEGSYSC